MPRDRAPKVHCAFRLPQQWKDQLDDRATGRAITTSALLCAIVRSYLNTPLTVQPAPRVADPVWPISKAASR
jgi:hypothetical protein